MRVVLISETYSKRMGYLENMLPKYMARLGVEMHVITSDRSLYYQVQESSSIYSGFASANELPAGTVENIDGVTVHVLPHKMRFGYMRMEGLRAKLQELRPDVVQTMTAVGWVPLDAAILRVSLGYQLFTGCHMHASVFPLFAKPQPAWSLNRLFAIAARAIPGFFVCQLTKKCYATAADCADIARRFYRVSKKKVEICPLGVDTDIFQPGNDEKHYSERIDLRRRLGFSNDEIVCIYSGRFSDEKNPLLLARAVDELTGCGEPYRGLFVGNGPQSEAIRQCRGCVTHPFVSVGELPAFYRAADIGIWPTQESLSMLDAAACGLPIIANDTVLATERVDGNGLLYRLGDQFDLVRALLLLRSEETRRQMGVRGAMKMSDEFSWERIARRRLLDYRTACRIESSYAF